MDDDSVKKGDILTPKRLLITKKSKKTVLYESEQLSCVYYTDTFISDSNGYMRINIVLNTSHSITLFLNQIYYYKH